MSLRERAIHRSLMQLFSHIDNEGLVDYSCVILLVNLLHFRFLVFIIN